MRRIDEYLRGLVDEDHFAFYQSLVNFADAQDMLVNFGPCPVSPDGDDGNSEDP